MNNNKFTKDKNEILSGLMKQLSKNKKKYNTQILKNFITSIPKIVYAMILLDSSLGVLAPSQNKIIRKIIVDKEHNIIQKVQLLTLIIFNSIKEDPYSLLSLMESIQIINKIKDNNISDIDFTDIKTVFTIIVWILEIK